MKWNHWINASAIKDEKTVQLPDGQVFDLREFQPRFNKDGEIVEWFLKVDGVEFVVFNDHRKE